MRLLHPMLRAAVFMFAMGFVLLFVMAALSFGQGAPLPSVQNEFFGATGIAAPLGFVCTTTSGTSTNLATYREVALTNANQNPIRLNAAGRPAFSGSEVSVFLQAAVYRITVHAAGTGSTCNGVTVGAVLRTADGISGANLYTLEFATALDDKVCHGSMKPGATEDVKIVACATVTPSTGGTVDLQGLQGPQSWAACPFTGITKPLYVIIAGSTVSSAANCTIPVNVTLDLRQGAIISQATSTTLTVNGPVVLTLGTHFAGAGAFAFGNRNPELYPQYWGALADGTTNDYTAFQATLDALETNGGRLLIAGNYFIDEQRLVYSSAKSLEVVGFGWDRSKITWDAPSGASPAGEEGLLNIHGAIGAHNARVRVEGIFFEGGSNRAAGYSQYKQGVNIYSSDNVTVRANHFKGFRAETVSLGNFNIVTEITDRGQRCWVEDNYIEDFAQDGINPNIRQCLVRANKLRGGAQAIEAGIPQITITDNDIEDMTVYGIAVSCIDNFVVSNNRFKNAANTNQGFVGASIYIVGNGRVEPSKNGVVANNVILDETEHANQVGIATALGSSATSSLTISFSGNNISGSRICMSPTALINSEIVNNTCLAGATSTYGIVLSEPSANVTTGNIVRGNIIRGTYSSAALDDATPHANLNQMYWNDTGNSVAGLPVTMTLQQGIPVVITVANNTVIKLASTALTGILGFYAMTTSHACIFDIAGANLIVAKIADTGSPIECGIAVGAENYNVYVAGGEYKFSNTSGASETFKFQLVTGIGEH